MRITFHGDERTVAFQASAYVTALLGLGEIEYVSQMYVFKGGAELELKREIPLELHEAVMETVMKSEHITGLGPVQVTMSPP